FFAIDRFVRPQDFVAEFFHDWSVGRLIGLDEFVAELIGVENAKVHFTQAGRDETLAAGDSSGEAKFQHKKSQSKDWPLQGRLCGWFGAAETRGLDSVAHEHGDGHGTDAAWNGSERA